jgi:hypothetical protein
MSIQEVPVSLLGRNTDYPEMFHTLPQSVYANAEKVRQNFPIPLTSTKSTPSFDVLPVQHMKRGYLSRYTDSLRAGSYRDRIPVVTRLSAPVQTGSGPHPATCIVGTGSLVQGKAARA